MEKLIKFFGAALLTIGGIMIIVPLGAIFGYIAGFIIKIMFGGVVAQGFNLLFNTQRFSPNDIPHICSALAVIGSYLRTTVTNKKD